MTLDDHASQNALTDEALEQLHDALDGAEADSASRALVIKGTPRVFCAGMSLEQARHDEPGCAAAAAERFFELMRRLTATRLTVVCVVEGAAIGGGVGLAAASDFVLATPQASFALPEALWGLVPCCVLPFLVRRVGFQSAYGMALGTLPVSAARARETGLVDELAEDPVQPLRRLLRRVTKLDPRTVAALKSYAAHSASIDPRAQRQAAEELERLLGGQPFQEALETYLRERRYPWEHSL